VTWHNKCSSILPGTSARKLPGSPPFEKKNKENETNNLPPEQSATLEEVVKLPLPLVWHGPKTPTFKPCHIICQLGSALDNVDGVKGLCF
jgi:hypothetical protein